LLIYPLLTTLFISFCCFLRLFRSLHAFISSASLIFLSCFTHLQIYLSHLSLLLPVFLSGASFTSFTSAS
jgi:hypothetical protein